MRPEHPASPSVHPRLRGEHAWLIFGMNRAGGSSPPARGTHCSGPDGVDLGRFIPACAGNTRRRRSSSRRCSVHPRLRGEHWRADDGDRQDHGSSPPARGTLIGHDEDITAERFIPACAGNTHDEPRHAAGSAVHPRLRGEHAPGGRTLLQAAGSSPPARGTRRRCANESARSRFIPACAGNTSESA